MIAHSHPKGKLVMIDLSPGKTVSPEKQQIA